MRDARCVVAPASARLRAARTDFASDPTPYIEYPFRPLLHHANHCEFGVLGVRFVGT